MKLLVKNNILLNKLLSLFETSEISDTWLDEFVLNPKILRDKAQKLNKINTQIVEQYQKLQPFFNMEEMTYHTIKELIETLPFFFLGCCASGDVSSE